MRDNPQCGAMVRLEYLHTHPANILWSSWRIYMHLCAVGWHRFRCLGPIQEDWEMTYAPCSCVLGWWIMRCHAKCHSIVHLDSPVSPILLSRLGDIELRIILIYLYNFDVSSFAMECHAYEVAILVSVYCTINIVLQAPFLLVCRDSQFRSVKWCGTHHRMAAIFPAEMDAWSMMLSLIS